MFILTKHYVFEKAKTKLTAGLKWGSYSIISYFSMYEK